MRIERVDRLFAWHRIDPVGYSPFSRHSEDLLFPRRPSANVFFFFFHFYLLNEKKISINFSFLLYPFAVTNGLLFIIVHRIWVFGFYWNIYSSPVESIVERRFHASKQASPHSWLYEYPNLFIITIIDYTCYNEWGKWNFIINSSIRFNHFRLGFWLVKSKQVIYFYELEVN